jgi:hypothetical protein
MQPVPRVPPFDRPATYENLVKLPDHLVAEVVDGELHATPRPAFAHVRAGASLGVVVGGPHDHGHDGPGGWWILDELELHLGTDVLAPDWVCEVLSPPTALLDRVKKLTIYAREGPCIRG